MKMKIDAALDDACAFTLEQAALQLGVRFADQKPSSGADHTMPGNPLAGRSSSHRVTRRAGAATQPEHASQLSVGHHPPSRDSFHEPIHIIPGHRHTPGLSSSRIARSRVAAGMILATPPEGCAKVDLLGRMSI